MKNINYLFITLIGVTLTLGCSKDATILTPSTNVSDQDLNARKSADLDRETVLGKKLQNPYTVEVMKRAYKSIEKENQVQKIDIKSNFLYIRFLPKDSVEYRRINSDDSFELFSYPLDYEISVKGNKYKDPSTKGNKYTWYYCVVDPKQPLPEKIKKEILAELYIPQNKNNNPDKAKSNSAELETLLTNLEKEALRITGNEYSNPNGRMGSYNPSGRITMSDDVLGVVGVEGAKVRANRWFTTYEAITDANGYFWMNSTFVNPCNYSIIWERADFDILEGGTFANFQAEYNGPKQSGGWYLNIDGGRSLMYAAIHRAAHYYYYQQNVLRTPRNGSFFSRLSISAYDWEQGNSNGDALTSGFLKSWLDFPDIRIFKPSRGPYAIYSTTIHELAHASHWAMNRENFRNTDDVIIESWARVVQWTFTNEEYNSVRPNWNNGIQGIDPTFQDGIANVYTPIFIDLIDDFNQSINISSSLPNDDVSGYTIRQMEDVLVGSRNMPSLRDNVINWYDNPTEGAIPLLFNGYGN